MKARSIVAALAILAAGELIFGGDVGRKETASTADSLAIAPGGVRDQPWIASADLPDLEQDTLCQLMRRHGYAWLQDPDMHWCP